MVALTPQQLHINVKENFLCCLRLEFFLCFLGGIWSNLVPHKVKLSSNKAKLGKQIFFQISEKKLCSKFHLVSTPPPIFTKELDTLMVGGIFV